MTNLGSAFEKITDFSFVENFQFPEKVYQLFNFLLYIAVVFPLVFKIDFPAIATPWGDISKHLLLAAGVCSYALLFWVARGVGKILNQFWLIGEDLVSGILDWIGIDPKREVREKYYRDNSWVTLYEAEKYLSHHEDKIYQRSCDEFREIQREKLAFRRCAFITCILMVSLLLLPDTWFRTLAQQVSWLVPASWATAVSLLFYAMTHVPDKWNYIYWPDNKIRPGNEPDPHQWIIEVAERSRAISVEYAQQQIDQAKQRAQQKIDTTPRRNEGVRKRDLHIRF